MGRDRQLFGYPQDSSAALLDNVEEGISYIVSERKVRFKKKMSSFSLNVRKIFAEQLKNWR
ncbi:MAG: hypothetical protein IIA61_00630 [Candidatus Marinimicrobia bacterium]|nr:hypothetical protein [Candidatus Neomarinimicrobiota bacterium]